MFRRRDGPPSVATPTSNQAFGVEVVLRNAGSRTVAASEVAIVIDRLSDPRQTCPASRQGVPQLVPGATATFLLTLGES